jgi:hypothetical protein
MVKLIEIGEQLDIASGKRDIEFHELFPAIDELDTLIEDFTCAWLNDILLHGRIYFTQSSVCFYSKVIWTYTVTIPIKDITSIEKKSVAGLFQNAIEITTAEKKYFFASFLSRNQAYDLLSRLIAGYPNNLVQDSGINVKYPRRPSLQSLEMNATRSKSVGSGELTRRSVHRSKSLMNIEASSMGLLDIAKDDIPSRNASPQSDSPSRARIVHQKKVVSVPSQDILLTRPKMLTPTIRNYEADPEPYECNCLPSHKDQKHALDTIVPLSVKDTWLTIYGHKSTFSELFWEKLKYTGIRI